MPRIYELILELDKTWDGMDEENTADVLTREGFPKDTIKVVSVKPLQEKRAKVSKITIKHILDETPDVSHLETTASSHFGKDGANWLNLSTEDRIKAIKKYGSVWDACVAYAKQDAERLAAFNRGDWHMIGIMAEAEVHIPEDTIPSPSWLIQLITSGGLWGIESDSGEEHFAEVEKEEIAQLKRHLKMLNIEGADDCPIVKEDE